jgi:hypothetical protein
MGLDMYLTAQRDLGFGDQDEDRGQKIQQMFPELEPFGKPRWGQHRIREITAEVGYWRKANAIHQWFVNNCQGGEDDCRSYEVTREQLSELLDICQRVLGFRHLANELLPRAAGFFFGSAEYDDGYYHDVQDTIDIVEAALTLPASWEFLYRSSW